MFEHAIHITCTSACVRFGASTTITGEKSAEVVGTSMALRRALAAAPRYEATIASSYS